MIDKTERFKKRIIFREAFDRRHPDPSKNGGIGGVDISFYLTGKMAVMQFRLATRWNLPSVPKSDNEPFPYDVGYHSPLPMYEGQSCMGPCDLLNGKDCYYDGSTLRADEYFKILVEKGSKGVWKELKEDYYARFYTGTGDDE